MGSQSGRLWVCQAGKPSVCRRRWSWGRASFLKGTSPLPPEVPSPLAWSLGKVAGRLQHGICDHVGPALALGSQWQPQPIQGGHVSHYPWPPVPAPPGVAPHGPARNPTCLHGSILGTQCASAWRAGPVQRAAELPELALRGGQSLQSWVPRLEHRHGQDLRRRAQGPAPPRPFRRRWLWWPSCTALPPGALPPPLLLLSPQRAGAPAEYGSGSQIRS